MRKEFQTLTILTSCFIIIKLRRTTSFLRTALILLLLLNYFEKPIKDKKPEDDYGERVVRYGNYGSAAYSHISMK